MLAWWRIIVIFHIKPWCCSLHLFFKKCSRASLRPHVLRCSFDTKLYHFFWSLNGKEEEVGYCPIRKKTSSCFTMKERHLKLNVTMNAKAGANLHYSTTLKTAWSLQINFWSVTHPLRSPFYFPADRKFGKMTLLLFHFNIVFENLGNFCTDLDLMWKKWHKCIFLDRIVTTWWYIFLYPQHLLCSRARDNL